MAYKLKSCTDFGDINRELREIFDRFSQLVTNDNGNTTALADAISGAFLAFSRGLTVQPPTRDSAGINAAIGTINLIGNGRGTVMYEDAAYDITAGIALSSNISHIGVAPKLDFTTNIPDATSVSGGTRFNLAAGVTGFYFNNTDILSANQASPLAPTACSNVEIGYITFLGGKSAIDTGANNAMGLVYSHMHDLYAYNPTGEAFNYENFQNCSFGNHFVRNTQAVGDGAPRGGIFFRMSIDLSAQANTLIPGNSNLYGIFYTLGGVRQTRHLVFECKNGAQMNEVRVTGYPQSNRYGAAAVISVTCVTTTGSPDITVSDPTQFADCQVGMPIVFLGTAPNPVSQYVTYWVYSRNTTNNTIQLANVPLASSAMTMNATNTYTATIGGYPGLEIHADATSLITNSYFGDVGTEMYYGTVSASFRRLRQCTVGIAGYFPSQAKSTLVCRDSNIAVRMLKIDNIGRCDYDGLGQFTIHNLIASDSIVTAGRTLTAADHGATIMYNSATDGTFTIPGDLVYGFKCQFVQLGAGVITIAAGGGATVASRAGGLRSAGVNAELRLRQKTLSMNAYASTYALSGDTQV